jgi:hypothetical protein
VSDFNNDPAGQHAGGRGGRNPFALFLSGPGPDYDWFC